MGAPVLATKVNDENAVSRGVRPQCHSDAQNVAVSAASTVQLRKLETKVQELEEQRRVEAEQYRNIIAEMASTCRSLQARIKCLEVERSAAESEGRRRKAVRRRTWQLGESLTGLVGPTESTSPRQSVDLKPPHLSRGGRMDMAVQTATQDCAGDHPQRDAAPSAAYDNVLLLKAWLWY